MFFFFSSRRRHTRCLSDWSSDVCSSDLRVVAQHRDAGQPSGAAVSRDDELAGLEGDRERVVESAEIGGDDAGYGLGGAEGDIQRAVGVVPNERDVGRIRREIYVGVPDGDDLLVGG